MNKYEIKRIVRAGILETNSSSSHSLCISRLGNNLSEFVDLDIRTLDDGKKIVYINNPEGEFGRNYFISNSCTVKIQYACGLAYIYSEYRKLPEIIEVIKSTTGVDDVIFQWTEEYKEALNKHKRSIWVEIPQIDHQSTDLFFQVFENKDTLKNFIFNPDSWIVGGSDESSKPHVPEIEDIGKEASEREVIASFDAGGEIGRLDFKIGFFPHEDITSSHVLIDDKLQGLCWDSTTLLPSYIHKSGNDFYTNKPCDKEPILCYIQIVRSEDFKKYYIVATNTNVGDYVTLEAMKEDIGSLNKSENKKIIYLLKELHLYSKKLGKIL